MGCNMQRLLLATVCIVLAGGSINNFAAAAELSNVTFKKTYENSKVRGYFHDSGNITVKNKSSGEKFQLHECSGDTKNGCYSLKSEGGKYYLSLGEKGNFSFGKEHLKHKNYYNWSDRLPKK